MYSYPIWLWGSPPTISLRYMYCYPIWLWGSPHNLPRVYVLLSNMTMRVPTQSPSGICTLIQSDYEGPPTISLKYMYSYPIWLSGSPHNLSQVYVLLSNLTMRVTPHNLPQVYVLLSNLSMRVPHNLLRVYYILLSNLTMRVTPHNLPQVYVLLSNLSMRVPPQSPTGILCTLIQSDYEGPPTISLRYMYSYPIWLWGSPTISLRYMYSYPIWLWGSPHNLPQVYVLLSNLTMMDPPQSPSGICTLIQSDYEGHPTISLRYMYSYPILLWWSPYNLPQVYVLLSNLTMRVPHNLPQVYVLLSNLTMRVPPTISLKYMYSYPISLWGSPHNLSQVYVLLSNLTMRVTPHNLPQVYVLLSNLSMRVPHSLPQVYYILLSNLTMRVTPNNLPQVYVLLSNLSMRVPPQSPSGICTLIQSDYDGPPSISLRYMYSYLICLWGSPHNLPQVYVLLSNLTMMVPPQSPSGICTLI